MERPGEKPAWLLPRALCVSAAIGAVGGAVIGGGIAWWRGEDVLTGAGHGFVIGGVIGLTGGYAASGALSVLGSSTAGVIGSGIVGGVVGDISGQGVELAFGWRCDFDPMQTLVSGVGGGLGALAGRSLARYASHLDEIACFPAGTMIRTEEGDKPIEEVRAGDLVLSADPATGKQSVQRVSRAFVRRASELITITTADGRTIEATPEHPFWVEQKGFVAAKKLARSDLLRSADGKFVAVAGVTSRAGEFTVYNFEVEGTHTYYAGGHWVHNTCPDPGAEAVAEYLTGLGRSVKPNPLQGVVGMGRQGDLLVDGLLVEAKGVQAGADSSTIRNTINNALRRGGQARNFVIDARSSGLSIEEARRGIRRALGARPGQIDYIAIIGDDFFMGGGP